jgi:hypothetical protein
MPRHPYLKPQNDPFPKNVPKNFLNKSTTCAYTSNIAVFAKVLEYTNKKREEPAPFPFPFLKQNNCH